MGDERQRRIGITVLLDDQQGGVAAHLWLERIGDGIGSISPDPNAMTFVRYDPALAQAIQDAWGATIRPAGTDVRWWLEPLKPDAQLVFLAGPSFGIPFALGLLHLFDETLPLLDLGIAITGAISVDEDGEIRPCSVSGYPAKLKAAQHPAIHTVLVPQVDLATARAHAQPGYAVEPYADLVAASDRASGLVGDIVNYLHDLIGWLKTPPAYYPPEIKLAFDFAALDQSVRISDKRLPWRRNTVSREREAAHRSGDTDDEAWMRSAYSRKDDERYEEVLGRSVIRPWSDVQAAPLAVLLGDPGYGKSWRLKAEAIETAERHTRTLETGATLLDDVVLPVFVRLPDLARTLATTANLSDAITLVIQQTPNRFVGLSDRFWVWLKDRLRDTLAIAPTRETLGTLLLLDGLDEVHGQRTRLRECLATLNEHPSRRILLASRMVGYDDTDGGGWPFAPATGPHRREFELLTLNPPQVKRFIKVWFAANPERASSVQRQINAAPALRSLAQIPLMLSFTCLLATGPDDQLPTRRTDLYAKVLDRLLDSEWRERDSTPDPGRRAAKRTVLTEVAWEFANQREGWTDQLPQAALSDALERSTAADRVYRTRPDDVRGSLLEEFRQDGIFIAAGAATSGHDDDIPYLWAHRSLAEYLVAHFLADQPDDFWKQVVEQHRWYDQDWVEPISLLGGTLEQRAGQLVNILLAEDDPFHAQLFLAARVLSVALSKSIGSRLTQMILQHLTLVLRHVSSRRAVATRALHRMGSTEAISTLYAFLNDRAEEFEVRQSVAYAFSELGDPEAVPTLCAILTNPAERWVIRQVAAKALGKLGNPEAVPALCTILTNPLAEEDRFLRSAVVEALGKLGDPMAIPALRVVVSNPAKDILAAFKAALALSDVGDVGPISDAAAAAGPRWRSILTLDADDTNDQILRDEYGDPVAIPALRAILIRPTYSAVIRKAAAEALTQASDSEHVQDIAASLLQAASDPSMIDRCHESLIDLAPQLYRACSAQEWPEWRKRCMPLARQVLKMDESASA